MYRQNEWIYEKMLQIKNFAKKCYKKDVFIEIFYKSYFLLNLLRSTVFKKIQKTSIIEVDKYYSKFLVLTTSKRTILQKSVSNKKCFF